ncbi:hypothetical protein MCOR25_002575 [Pyricularia grisea]|uniref:Uncharacterized protein n=1 Tax=Pyricularia grisea TaxID=148305 RepID=A0A6P8AZS0_PYRGI|nr:hypothetical protein PgNI_10478 [Pyricularia grisea]KAI6377320.1 hypothetical protein MCOR25_002575 [Pyricularia grisea]TLD07835.1 hypothetical protein PgNI_10478 [Pyricularia grisea]
MSSFVPSSFRPSPGSGTLRHGRFDRYHMDDKGKSARSSPHRNDHYQDHEDDDEQFVMSVAGTPIKEETPKLNAHRQSNLASSWASFESKDSRDSKTTSDDLQLTASEMTTGKLDADMERSRPIAIEMPAKRMVGNQQAPTPTAPLSARGDLPGGYFPEHEDRKRVHRTHPFHADIKEARKKSIARAGVDCSPEPGDSSQRQGGSSNTLSSSVTAGLAAQSGGSGSSGLISAMAAKSHSSSFDKSSSPSISAYNPTGAEDNLLPMGKYYPTNWEARKKAKRAKQASAKEQPHHGGASPDGYFPKHPSPSMSPSVASSSSSVMSKPENPAVTRAKAPQLKGHSRSDSEARRRLQQYQRDMITQTSLGAHRVLGTQIQQLGADEVFQALNQLPALHNLHLPPRSRGDISSGTSQLPASALAGSYLTAVQYNILSKPASPRLQPLGSPGGPVTPMDLSSASDDKSLGASGRPRMPATINTAPARDRRHISQGSFPFGQVDS